MVYARYTKRLRMNRKTVYKKYDTTITACKMFYGLQ